MLDICLLPTIFEFVFYMHNLFNHFFLIVFLNPQGYKESLILVSNIDNSFFGFINVGTLCVLENLRLSMSAKDFFFLQIIGFSVLFFSADFLFLWVLKIFHGKQSNKFLFGASGQLPIDLAWRIADLGNIVIIITFSQSFLDFCEFSN